MSKILHGFAKRKLLLLALALALVSAAGFGYWRVLQAEKLTAAQASSGYQSTAVRKGSISVSINGTGSVKTEQSYDLGFPVSGTLGELDVEASQTVTKGERLAALSGEDVAQLELNVKVQQTAVQAARQKLDRLTNGANTTLAQALLEQAAAEAALAEAKTKLLKPGQGRCEQATTETLYYKYLDAEKAVQEWEPFYNDGNSGYGRDFLIQKLNPLWKARDKAYANWMYCQSYTGQEVLESQAALKTAQANLDAATIKVEKLKASSGMDTTGLEIAAAELANARAQLSAAQEELAGAVITAPIDGIVTGVNAEVGDAVRAVSAAADDTEVVPNSIITVTSQDNPYVEVTIDETDLQNLAVGCPAAITFDSLTGQSFSGSVEQIAPSLSDTSGNSMVASLTQNGPGEFINQAGASGVRALVTLDQKRSLSGKALPVGLSANVEITCRESTDVLIAPAQGLYQPQNASPYVYILTADGRAEKREVTIGLKTVALVEITGGLSEGDRVITSAVEQ